MICVFTISKLFYTGMGVSQCCWCRIYWEWVLDCVVLFRLLSSCMQYWDSSLDSPLLAVSSSPLYSVRTLSFFKSFCFSSYCGSNVSKMKMCFVHSFFIRCGVGEHWAQKAGRGDWQPVLDICLHELFIDSILHSRLEMADSYHLIAHRYCHNHLVVSINKPILSRLVVVIKYLVHEICLFQESCLQIRVNAIHSQYEIIITVNNIIGGFQNRLGGWLLMGRRIKLIIIFINVLSWTVK